MKPRVTTKAETSRVMRISGDNFERITRLKAAYAKKHAKKKVTYDEMLLELLKVSEALMAGDEIYVVGDRVSTNLAAARGEAILAAVKAGSAPVWPDVCVRLGKDPGVGHE